MTKEEFRKLAEQTLILDGATGSNLMASGMPRGICTETWVIDHKDIIQDLQRAYIKAGSQVIMLRHSAEIVLTSKSTVLLTASKKSTEHSSAILRSLPETVSM